MKRLFFILLAFVSLNTVAQETVTEPQISEAERIIDKYGGQAVEAFNNAVTKVTPMAEQGFEMTVKLQIAKGLVSLLPFIMSIILLIIFYKYPKEDWFDDYDGPSPRGIVGIVLIVLILVFILLAILYTGDGILHLLAPEWYAIKEILNLIK
jgi:hypothetical protein